MPHWEFCSECAVLCTFPFYFCGGGMLYVLICISSLETVLIILFIISFARMTQNIWLKTNHYIIKYVIYCTVQIQILYPPTILTLPALYQFVCYTLHSLNRSMLVAIFPQKARTTVCLGFFINLSSMIQLEGRR